MYKVGWTCRGIIKVAADSDDETRKIIEEKLWKKVDFGLIEVAIDYVEEEKKEGVKKQ